MKRALLHIARTKVDAVNIALERGDRETIASLAEPTGQSFAQDVVEQLFAVGMQRFPGSTDKARSQLDAFLAPRLHAALRLPRSIARDSGIWCWLATIVLWNYMDHRWHTEPEDNWWRFTSPDVLRNGIARLWWGGELIRSGPDYRLVPQGFASVRAFQNISELTYSWHRECARAFTRVLTKNHNAGDELGPTFNAYLRTQSLEAFDRTYDERERVSWDGVWGGREPRVDEVTADTADLRGPNAGFSRIDVEDRLVEWLEEIYRNVKARDGAV